MPVLRSTVIGFAEDFPVEAFTAGLVWFALELPAEEVAEDTPVEADALPVELVFPEDALFLFAFPALPDAEASVFAEATAVEDVPEPLALLPEEVPLAEDAFVEEDAFAEGVLLTTVFTVFGAEDSLRPDELPVDVLLAEEPVFFAD